MAPKIQYARSGDVHIAYTAVGDGPLDVVFVPGFVSSIDLTLANLEAGLQERRAAGDPRSSRVPAP